MPPRCFQPLVLKRHLEDGEDMKKTKQATPANTVQGNCLWFCRQKKKVLNFSSMEILFKGKKDFNEHWFKIWKQKTPMLSRT